MVSAKKTLPKAPLTEAEVKKNRLMSSLTKMTDDLVDATGYDDKWECTLRASSLPLCEYYVALSDIYAGRADRPEKLRGMMFDYYTSIGTLLHTILQRWMGKLGVLYGDYKCSVCKETIRGVLGEPSECSKGCKRVEWEYVELKLHEMLPTARLVSAHCDGLIRFPWMEEGHYYLMDIKTTSLGSCPSPDKRFTKDYHQRYLVQTAIYHHILTQCGFKIDGTIFWMVPRDNPRKMVGIIYDQSKTAEFVYWETVESYRTAKAAAKAGDFSEIKRSCKDVREAQFANCPFQDTCMNRNGDELIAQAISFKKNLPIAN